ncbi:hypothetical protein BLFGPEAP_01876 [Candidatus Methanoperedenaceae archaeon GB50]|nr:hypothetical protein BLFGPEAP_01876 [Candidatus Methanoperedenaceae archaeon GB50]
MIWQFDLVLLILVILAAIAAIEVRDLFAAAVFLGVFSFIMCMVWTEMGSVDVGLYRSSSRGRCEYRLFYCGCL